MTGTYVAFSKPYLSLLDSVMRQHSEMLPGLATFQVQLVSFDLVDDIQD